MREIKFRGKQIDNGEWVYGSLIGSDVIVGDIIEFTEEYFNCEYWWRVKPETVGQYTGLKDKNGKEICGGDFVDFWGGEYCQGHWEYEGNIIADFADCSGLMMLGEAENIEIIGNIHDNPELFRARGGGL